MNCENCDKQILWLTVPEDLFIGTAILFCDHECLAQYEEDKRRII